MKSTHLATLSANIAATLKSADRNKAAVLAFLLSEPGTVRGLAASVVVATCEAASNGGRPKSTTDYQSGQFAAVRGFFERTVGIACTFNAKAAGAAVVPTFKAAAIGKAEKADGIKAGGFIAESMAAILRTVTAAAGHEQAEPAKKEKAEPAAPETAETAEPAAPVAPAAVVSLADTLKALFAGFAPVAIAESMAADMPKEAAELCAALIAAGMAPAGTKKAGGKKAA